MHNIIISRSGTGLGLNSAASLIKKAINAALSAEGLDIEAEINVLLTDDEGIRAINAEFRGIDSATDVLSFPMFQLRPGDFDASDTEIDLESGFIPLGDIALSIPRALNQAEEYGHSAGREISYLSVHSVLHLLGYDHVDEGEMKSQMRDRERAIMRILGDL